MKKWNVKDSEGVDHKIYSDNAQVEGCTVEFFNNYPAEVVAFFVSSIYCKQVKNDEKV